MVTGLEHLIDEGIITEIVARLQGGKEADVFAVRCGGKVVAAKVYKNRAHRSFKNDSAYKEGRTLRNSRSQRAVDRGSRFGQAAAEDAWKSAEADALYKLHAADVRVPTPVMFLDGVLLMELVLAESGDIAPRLIDVRLSSEQACAAYNDMITQLVRILCCDLIHGDLSPYNVLWGAGGPTIIDLPQIVSASHNSRSEFFFLRDARNILGHFAGIDRRLNARYGDPAEIWRAYVSRELGPDFRPAGSSRAPSLPHHRAGGRPRGRLPPNRPDASRDQTRSRSAPGSSQKGAVAASEGTRSPPSGGSRRQPRGPEVIVRVRGSTHPPSSGRRRPH
jgi:RIO kinase 1